MLSTSSSKTNQKWPCQWLVVCYIDPHHQNILSIASANHGYQNVFIIYLTLLQLTLDVGFGEILRWHPQLNDYDGLLEFCQAILHGGQGDGKIWAYWWYIYRLLWVC